MSWNNIIENKLFNFILSIFYIGAKNILFSKTYHTFYHSRPKMIVSIIKERTQCVTIFYNY